MIVCIVEKKCNELRTGHVNFSKKVKKCHLLNLTSTVRTSLGKLYFIKRFLSSLWLTDATQSVVYVRNTTHVGAHGRRFICSL